MCLAMNIPESTIRAIVRRVFRSGLPIVVVQPIHLTGRRLLTDAEEEQIYNLVTECHARCIIIIIIIIIIIKVSSGGPEHGHPGGPPIRL